MASWGGANTLLANTFYANIGRYFGGLFLFEAEDFLSNNTIISNTTDPEYYGMGGGLMIDHSPATLKGNLIQGNHSNRGGGLYVYYSDATLDGNVIERNNSDGEAGGLYLLSCNASLNGNRIPKNTAGGEGGLFIGHGDTILTNNIIIENYSPYYGSGIAIDSSRRFHSPTLMIHNTIARNTGGDGSGVLLLVDTDVVLSNTILVSQSVGIETGIGNNTAILEGMLWGSGIWANGQDWVGEGIIIGTVNVWGDPEFINPDGGDYHIGHGSAAIDAGVEAECIRTLTASRAQQEVDLTLGQTRCKLPCAWG